METIQKEITPKVETQTETPAVQAPQEDLIKKVSQVKLESEAKQPEKAESENPFGLTREDWEKVQSDPVLKKYYASMQTGLVKKTQEFSNEKFHLQKKIEELTDWTPQRIQQLLQDPKFVEAAQNIIQQNPAGSTAEYETEEAKEIKQLKTRLAQLEGTSFQTLMRQQDENLKSKYVNYDPQKVDIITNEMLTGKVQATREHLWKVLDYEDAIKRAYELGKQDRQQEIKTNIPAMSLSEGSPNITSGEKPEKLPNEDDRSFLRRIFLDNLNKAQSGKK